MKPPRDRRMMASGAHVHLVSGVGRVSLGSRTSKVEWRPTPTKPTFAASEPLPDTCPLFISQPLWRQPLALGHTRLSPAIFRTEVSVNRSSLA